MPAPTPGWYVGLDFGTTNSAVAVAADSHAVLAEFETAEGRRIRSRRSCILIAAATRLEQGSVPTQALTQWFSTCRLRTKGG